MDFYPVLFLASEVADSPDVASSNVSAPPPFTSARCILALIALDRTVRVYAILRFPTHSIAVPRSHLASLLYFSSQYAPVIPTLYGPYRNCFRFAMER